ncbi:MAG: ATP--guanido phosphotransferase, partial [Verrucomicrobia bacterium]|nr:ATP--guanido phosphotransferase [Verrucomicrobiota bacterium]
MPATNLHEFLIPSDQAARLSGPNSRIVMSSRVRLARNLKGFAFPGWAK